jgi:hypothetical protein
MSPNNDTIEAGAWVGRQQAFALIGGKCSTARAQCLREIRESRAYEKFGVNWEEFCTRYAGISRSQADALIREDAELGDQYAKLSQIARISPNTFRHIEPHVKNDAIEFEGESIPLTPENAPRVREAVRKLRAEIKTLHERDIGRLIELSDRLNHLTRDFEAAIETFRKGNNFNEVTTLHGLAELGVERFGQIAKSTRPPKRP